MRGAREHNLKNISVSIPRNRLTVITGLSGSGKSSLAFDTIYAEGQRRYVESLSAYARQFLGLMEKPDVDAIEGLSPAISIEQKTTGQNPRSTVGTVTEIYDYLRLLWARVGIPHCPNDGTPVTRQSAAQITDAVLALAGGDPDRGAGAAGARPQGRVPRPLRGRAQARLRARAGRRRDLRPGLGAGTQPAPEPRHRRRGRPAGRARPTTAAASPTRSRRRSSRPTGWWRWCGTATRTLARLLRALRLSGVRPLAPRARAAPVLLQLAVRRLSRLPRARHPARGERRPGPRRSQHLDPRGRDPALGRADRLPAQGRAADARQGVQVRPQRALGRAQRRGPAGAAARRARHGSSSRPTAAAAAGEYESEWEGVLRNVERRYRETTQRRGARLARGVHDRAALPDLRRQAAQAGEPLGAGRGREHRRRGGPVGRARHRVLRGHPAARAGAGPGSIPRSPGRSSRR